MRVRASRGYKFILWALTLACLSGAGYLGYRTFYTSASPSRTLQSAEEAYARGIAAYDQKNWEDAVLRFDEAKLLAEKAQQYVDEEAKSGKLSLDEGKSLLGQVLWVKARAIRDHAYARAQLDGKPIAEVPDPQFGENYRPFGMITDPTARDEAVVAMRKAGGLIGTTDPEVLKEALRLELVLSPIQWNVAIPLLKEAIKQNPKDARANYYLARYEYDQPESGITAPEKKSLEGIERARSYLKDAKSSGAQYWRTVGLEAEILSWTTQPAVVKAKRLKSETVATAERELDELLFDPDNGAVVAAQRGENLAAFGRADGPGLVSVLLIATERAIAEANRPGGTIGRIRTVTRAALDATGKLAENPTTRPHLPEVLLALSTISASAQPYLAKSDPGMWRDYVTEVQAALEKAGDASRTIPSMRFQLAQMGFADAMIAARAGDTEQSKSLIQKSLALAEAGIKAAEDAKLPTAETDTYHELVAQWKLMTGAKADAIEPHLARLRASAVPKSRLMGQFLDAIMAERQGRLEKARRLLQPLAADKSKENAAMARRAHMVLANLNLVLGDPSAALVSLREIEPTYKQLEMLPPIERAWQEEFGRGGVEENIAQQIRAHLQVALQIAARHKRQNPKTPVPAEQVEPSLRSARDLLKRLRAPSAADRSARLALVAFNLLVGRKNDAEAMLTQLATSYPDNIEVLRTRCTILAMPEDSTRGATNANGVAAADALIRKFLKDYPADKASRLFNAEWLIRTDRADKAVEYLRDPLNFPGGRDAAVDRILSAALLRTGQREAAQKILSTLPHDPRLDAVLIQTAVTRESGEQALKEALGRYENQGGFRIYEAAMRLREGKYEEAIQGFVSAIEFTEVSANARAGLVMALSTYASVEPAMARDAAIRLAGEIQDLPGLYLAVADAALQLNEIGDPTDRWENTKTMYAAVNKWEAVAVKSGASRGDLALVRARARLLAGDPDGARRDATTALVHDPENVTIMIMLAELSLMAPADTTRAREFYEAALKKSPNNPVLPSIDARIKGANGDWIGAAAVYQRLLNDAPRNSGFHAALVAALDSAGQKDNALRAAQEWLGKLPDDPRGVAEVIRLLTLGGKKPEALKLANEFVEKEVKDVRKRLADAGVPVPKADADKIVENARIEALLATISGFFRGKDYTEAEDRANDILRSQPKHKGALLILGDIATATKQWDKAIAIYREMLKDNPRHFVAGNNLAWILAEQKNEPVTALSVVEEIRKGRVGDKPIGPERLPADFLDTLGVVYLKLNRSERYPEMRAVFEAGVRRYPADPRMFLFLGHAQAGSGERSKALASFDAAIRLAGQKNSLPDEQKKAVVEAAAAARKKLEG